jgi:hypothetical protein
MPENVDQPEKEQAQKASTPSISPADIVDRVGIGMFAALTSEHKDRRYIHRTYVSKVHTPGLQVNDQDTGENFAIPYLTVYLRTNEDEDDDSASLYVTVLDTSNNNFITDGDITLAYFPLAEKDRLVGIAKKALDVVRWFYDDYEEFNSTYNLSQKLEFDLRHMATTEGEYVKYTKEAEEPSHKDILRDISTGLGPVRFAKPVEKVKRGSHDGSTIRVKKYNTMLDIPGSELYKLNVDIEDGIVSDKEGIEDLHGIDVVVAFVDPSRGWLDYHPHGKFSTTLLTSPAVNKVHNYRTLERYMDFLKELLAKYNPRGDDYGYAEWFSDFLRGKTEEFQNRLYSRAESIVTSLIGE